MLKVLLIALGGGLGSVLRFYLGGLIQPKGAVFAWGTLAVNLLGCFAIGVLVPVLMTAFPHREEYRLAIVTGVLGGFTTFSAFSLETNHALGSDRTWVAITYVVVSVLGGLAATWAGSKLVH